MGKLGFEQEMKKFQKEALAKKERRLKKFVDRTGPAAFSQEGLGLKRVLGHLGYRGVKVFPTNFGPPFNNLWECHVLPTVTGFTVRFRINGKNREGVVILAPQDKLLRREIEGAVNAWWQALLPSDIISPAR